MRRMLSVIFAGVALVAAALPASAISGTVVNQKGKAVPNARVELHLSYDDVKTVTSDAKGAWTYTPPEGKGGQFGRIMVIVPGYAYSSASGDYRQRQKESVKIVLQPEKKLKGKVVDENGKPVAGAKITLRSLNASTNDRQYINLDGPVQEVTAKPDGTFTIDHLPDPASLRYIYGEIEVTADGRALISQNLSEEDLGATLVITDPVECKLQGTVYAPDKSVVTGGVRLSIPGSGGGGSDGRSAVVGKDGRYSFDKLPPGEFQMILDDVFEKDYVSKEPTGAKASWVLPAVPIELLAGKTLAVDVNLAEGVLIKGKVVNNVTGKEFKYAELFVVHAGRPEDTHQFLTPGRGISKEGEFSCYVVPGEVDVSPQSVGEGTERAHFYSEDKPHLAFTAVAGQPKTDLVFKIDPAVAGEPWARPKPIPPDLELTAGTYGLEWDPDLECQYSMRGKSYSGDEARSKILKLPKLASKSPLFYAVQLDGPSDDGLFLYAVDESGGTGAGYDTIYADRNRNRSLVDDEPMKIRKPASRTTQRSAWVKVPSHQESAKGASADNPLRIRFEAMSYQGTVYVNLKRTGAWKGKIDTNKGRIDCLIADTNGNGTYGDRMAITDDLKLSRASRGDFLFADLNLSGRVSTEPAMEMPQLLQMQEATMVAGRLYSIRVSPTGDKITIANYAGPMGTLLASPDRMKSLGASVTSVSLIGKSGYHSISHYDGKPIALPAGKYSFYRCAVSLPQTAGGKLSLDCLPKLTVNVRAGQQARAQLGGKPVVRGIDPDKKVVYLNSGNQSQAGLLVNLGDNITIARVNGTGDYNDSYAPDMKITDRSGNVVAASRTSYT